MSFEIITTVSPDFADGIKLFVPSWFRNANADRITIYTTPQQSWYEGIITRNMNLARSVRKGKRIVSLDIDIFVLGDLSGGFDGKHPIAVARWPNPNMGVAFFDGMLDFDWSAFFNPLLGQIVRRCRDPSIWGNENKKGRFGDQIPWYAHLQNHEKWVRKLDMNEWNFCYQPEDWAARFLEHKHEIRIAHVKGRGRWEQQPRIKMKIDSLRRAFPGKIKE